MNKYKVVIYWSDEDDCFVGLVPELSGCCGDGKTREECMKNVEENINDWLDIAKENGWEIPEATHPKDAMLEKAIAI